jgi:hypothetical protein
VIDIKEWKWEKVKPKEKTEHTLSCPYCNVKVRATSDTRIFDADTGAIKYHIFKCPECYMPITIGLDGKIIPPSLFLPFEDIPYLPTRIEKMYCECRKCFSNECFYSVIMVARTIIMHIAADLGAASNLKFIEYIDYLEKEGYISRRSRTWVDKIRRLGNQYIHELDEATKEEAELAIIFIMHLLIDVYKLPQMAK